MSAAAATGRPVRRGACLRAYEDVIELRSLLALACEALPPRSRVRAWLEDVRLDLLDLAAAVVEPLAGGGGRRLDAASVRWLRAVQVEAQLMLPPDAPSRPWPHGVTAVSTRLLLARAAARSAAADVAAAGHDLDLDPLALEYLDRLSMLLLTLARIFGRGVDGSCRRRPLPLLPAARLRLRVPGRAVPAPA